MNKIFASMLLSVGIFLSQTAVANADSYFGFEFFAPPPPPVYVAPRPVYAAAPYPYYVPPYFVDCRYYYCNYNQRMRFNEWQEYRREKREYNYHNHEHKNWWRRYY